MHYSVIIMAKYPTPGFVKTRLQGFLKPEQCAKLYQCFLLDTIDCVRCTEAKVFISLKPKGKIAELQASVPKGTEIFEQQGIDLGENMDHAINYVYERYQGRILVIGADIPLMQPCHLAEAAKSLDQNDLCLGPAVDGGYYLIGLNKPEKLLFTGINWSSEIVMEQTLEIAQNIHHKIHTLDPLSDIDTISDLNDLGRELNEPLDKKEFIPERTKEYLSKIFLN